MLVEALHYRFNLMWDENYSHINKTFSAAETDTYLSVGVNELTEILYSGNNLKKYKLGFEVTQQRIDMLSTLVVGQPEQPAINPTNFNSDLNLYEFDFVDLIEPYKHLLKVRGKIKKCDDLFNVVIKQHDDLNRMLGDANQGCSLKWRRALAEIKRSSNPETEKSLYVYTEGKFEVDSVYIEFLKRPSEICLGNYRDMPTIDNPNPGLKPRSECDLPEDVHDLVVQVAVQVAARALTNVAKMQIAEKGSSDIIQ